MHTHALIQGFLYMMHDLVLITLNWLFKNLGRHSLCLQEEWQTTSVH